MECLRRACAPETQELIRLVSRHNHATRASGADEVRPFWTVVRDLIISEKPRLCVFDLKLPDWSSIWHHVRDSIPSTTHSIGVDVPVQWIDQFDDVIHPGVTSPKDARGSGNWHGGPEWVLVDRDPVWHPNREEESITVTTGSQSFTSFHSWLGAELRYLFRLGADVSWVVGTHFEDKIAELQSHSRSVKYVTDENLINRFTSSVFVMARFGVTVFELAARGVPTLVLPEWNSNEELEILELERNGVVIVARSRGEVGKLGESLLNNISLQHQLSEASKAYFRLEATHPASDLIGLRISGNQ